VIMVAGMGGGGLMVACSSKVDVPVVTKRLLVMLDGCWVTKRVPVRVFCLS